jgi:hypothetical protein
MRVTRVLLLLLLSGLLLQTLLCSIGPNKPMVNIGSKCCGLKTELWRRD